MPLLQVPQNSRAARGRAVVRDRLTRALSARHPDLRPVATYTNELDKCAPTYLTREAKLLREMVGTSFCGPQQRRRLRNVTIALQPTALRSVTLVEDENPDAALALERPLAQRADGQVEEFEFERLRVREAEAVDRRQYRLATQLRDLQECFDPRNQLTLQECCPPTLETQYQFFLRNGVSFCPPRALFKPAGGWPTGCVCLWFSLSSSLTQLTPLCFGRSERLGPELWSRSRDNGRKTSSKARGLTVSSLRNRQLLRSLRLLLAALSCTELSVRTATAQTMHAPSDSHWFLQNRIGCRFS